MDTLAHALPQTTEAASEPSPKRQRIFEPELTAFDAKHLGAFMKEVKEKKTTSGLSSRSYWPSSLAEHLCIERTASLINAVRISLLHWKLLM